jgi:primosomal protein N' (replication factor Y) (superfamily II helicase)
LISAEIGLRTRIFRSLVPRKQGAVVLMPRRNQKNQYFSSWQAARHARVVVGPVTALFLPFKNLKQIVVVEAESPRMQTAEQNPRFHLADIVSFVADTYAARLLVTGFSPDIALLKTVQDKKQPVVRIGSSLALPDVVNMKEQAPQRPHYFLSNRALAALDDPEKRVLLIYNRHGNSRVFRCRDCSFVALCERCTKPLLYGASKSRLICITCERSHDMLLRCPECKGANFYYRGIGTTSIKNLIEKDYVERSVVEFSSKKNSTSAKLETFNTVVATNAIFSRHSLTFDTAIMINADVDLRLSNYHAGESLRHYIMALRMFAPEVVVQTYSIDHYIYRTLDSVTEFYRKEIDWRSTYQYPPFGLVIALKVRDTKKKNFDEKIQKLEKKLAHIKHFGPLTSVSGKNYLADFIIKVGAQESPTSLDDLLQGSYTAFHIEINPYQITGA